MRPSCDPHATLKPPQSHPQAHSKARLPLNPHSRSPLLSISFSKPYQCFEAVCAAPPCLNSPDDPFPHATTILQILLLTDGVARYITYGMNHEPLCQLRVPKSVRDTPFLDRTQFSGPALGTWNFERWRTV